jgi:MerR family transcriptional regulator, light-induced transcriptional regulator
MATVIEMVRAATAYLPQTARSRMRQANADPRRAAVAPSRPESVTELIERQIIPRLMVAHRSDAAEMRKPFKPDAGITAEEARAFGPLALEVEADTLLNHVEIFLRRGVEIDTLFVDLLAPAARHLGTMWEEDECDFVDVTMGLWRLQEIVRELSARMPGGAAVAGDARRALFAPMPGEQHSLGAIMVEDVFRRSGWLTDLAPDCNTPDLLDLVARRSFDLIGLTVSLDDNIARLPSLVVALRSVSRNPHIRIMLGGRVLANDAGLAARVGADGTAPDAIQAVVVAGHLVDAIAARERHDA